MSVRGISTGAAERGGLAELHDLCDGRVEVETSSAFHSRRVDLWRKRVARSSRTRVATLEKRKGRPGDARRIARTPPRKRRSIPRRPRSVRRISATSTPMCSEIVVGDARASHGIPRPSIARRIALGTYPIAAGRPAKARDGHRVILPVIEPVGRDHGLSHVCGRLFRSAIAHRKDPARPRGSGLRARITELMEPPFDVFHVGEKDGSSSGSMNRTTHVEQAIGDARLVPDSGRKVDLLLVPDPRGGRVGLPVGQASEGGCRPCASDRHTCGARKGKCALGQSPALGTGPNAFQKRQRSRESEGDVAFVVVDRPALGRLQVGDVRSDAIEDGRVREVPSPDSLVDEEGEHSLRVSTPRRRLVAVDREAPRAVGLDRPQQTESSPPPEAETARRGSCRQAPARRRGGRSPPVRCIVDLLDVEAAVEDRAPGAV